MTFINLKCLENEKSFSGKTKAFFIIFKGLSVAQNCLRPESAPLMQEENRFYQKTPKATPVNINKTNGFIVLL